MTLAAGTLGEGCRAFVDLALAVGGKAESSILGFGAKVPAAMAALANGAMSHALDYEDVHDGALVHPNATTVPAALAVAESLGRVRGEELITAMALGSDLVCRLGLALSVNLLDYGWYAPPILGAFGAAVAAGKLLGLTAAQMLDALSLTLCQATCSAELTHSPRSLIRSVRDAFPAQAGVVSALLAQAGVTGFERPLEGERGFFQAYARGNYDPAVLTDALGTTFYGAGVSFKPWPTCRGTHPYIEGLLSIRHDHRLQPGDVAGIEIVVSPANRMLCEPLAAKQSPVTAIDAKFSLPFVLATALVHGNVALGHFSPQALRNAAVRALAQKVSYAVDAGLTVKEALRGRIEIRTGRETLRVGLPEPLGSPGNPMTRAQLVAKFMDCAAHAHRRIPAGKLEQVVALVCNLEAVDDVHTITELLSA